MTQNFQCGLLRMMKVMKEIVIALLVRMSVSSWGGLQILCKVMVPMLCKGLNKLRPKIGQWLSSYLERMVSFLHLA